MKYSLLITIIIFSLLETQLSAQKNGVAGYGRLESNVVFTLQKKKDVYVGAGGGVIINDNLIFGAFLKALAKPYTFNAIKAINSGITDEYENPYSYNENAFSSTINNIEIGGTAGFNIAPEKPLQATIRLLLGYNISTINEISLYEDENLDSGFYLQETTSILSGINSSVELEGQFKIGRSFKAGLLAGFHFAYVNGSSAQYKKVLKNPFMFSGGYLGLAISFGSFQ